MSVLLMISVLLAGIIVAAPTASASQSVSKLLITEVCFNPSYEENNRKATGDNDFFEFIEIKNVGKTAVDMKNAKVKYSRTGIKGTAWYTNALVFESGNSGTMAPGAVWVLGYYNQVTSRLGLAYDTETARRAYWSKFNEQYGSDIKTANRAICTAAQSGTETLLTCSLNLPNSDETGAIRIVSGDVILGAIEYSPNKYNANAYALQTEYRKGMQYLSGIAGCSPGTVYPYQEPESDTRAAATGDCVSVLSYNVCYDVTITDPVSAPLTELTVEKRAPRLVSYLKSAQKDIVCLQEMNSKWFPLVTPNLKEYRWVGESNRGSQDGASAIPADVYNPIFYKTSAVTLKDYGDFWLHEADATNTNKVCTWALFQLNSTGSYFAVFNTHFSVDDSDGTYTRRLTETENLLDRMKAQLKSLNRNNSSPTGEIGAVLCGDFNINEGTLLYRKIAKCGWLQDCKYVARATENVATYMNWGNMTKDNGTVIDLCFVNSGADVATYEVIEDNLISGLPISDHNAVELDLRIASNAPTEDNKKADDNGFYRVILYIKTFFEKLIEFAGMLFSAFAGQ